MSLFYWSGLWPKRRREKGNKETRHQGINEAAFKRLIGGVAKKAVKKKVIKKAPAKGKAGQVDQKARKALLEKVRVGGSALEHADKIFKADREIVLAAVKDWGGALRYASKSLRADHEFALKAVKHGIAGHSDMPTRASRLTTTSCLRR